MENWWWKSISGQSTAVSESIFFSCLQSQSAIIVFGKVIFAADNEKLGK